MNGSQAMVKSAGRAAVVGGLLALASLATVLVGESTKGEDFMSMAGAELAGWAGFVGSALLVVGLLGLAVGFADVLSGAGRVALLVLGFSTAMTVGASSSLALVVPTLVERLPEIVTEPPAAVPPTFIFSGLVMGVCALVIAVGLRTSGATSRGLASLMIAGAVVAMVPLPSRFFLLSLAVGAVLLREATEARRAIAEREPVAA